MTKIEIVAPRDVPLGGLRAMDVRRTLPTRERSMIGAWCFLDHYGPDMVSQTGGMVVSAHPHTGLQTVSWLFEGEIEHRDSAGHRQLVRPGEVNLMTAGRGISHTEVSTPDTSRLHGVQLWVALPDAVRHTDPAFEHARAPQVLGDGYRLRVFLGESMGARAEVTTHSPLVGLEAVVDRGAELTLPLRPHFEYGVLVDRGAIVLDDTPVAVNELAYVPQGRDSIRLQSAGESRLIVIGGEPLGERIVMWWNFVGREHAEVAGFRAQWQALLAGQEQDRFSFPDDDRHPPIPAPDLPRNVRLAPR